MLRFFNFLRSWHYAIRPIFGPKNFISAQIFEEGEAKEGDINEGQEIKIKAEANDNKVSDPSLSQARSTEVGEEVSQIFIPK